MNARPLLLPQPAAFSARLRGAKHLRASSTRTIGPCRSWTSGPINPGHVLVIPKDHAAALADLKPFLGGHLFERAMAAAAALRQSGLRCEGVNVHLADGEAAGQEVFHVHLHVFPRYRGDGLGLRVGPNYGRIADRKELDELRRNLRAVFPVH